MPRSMVAELEDILCRYATVDVLRYIALEMQRPGVDSEKLVALGRVIEGLTDQSLWD